MSGELEIRQLDLEGVRQAVEWAESEGWEPGLTDAEPFHAADPNGFFAATVDGVRVATISLVRYSKDVAFVGLYIVEPGLRGNGYGKRLWDETLAGFPGSIGGDAVPAQIENYESDGFHVAYGNARYSSDTIGAGAIDAGGAAGQSCAHLVNAGTVDFGKLVEFDGRHCFGPRPDFLKLWIEGPGRESLVAIDDGEITGFAASRKSSLGHRIGPVFTGDGSVARSLIIALAKGAGGRVAVDVPLPNAGAVELVESLGMERSFGTARIYKGPDPDLPLDRIFGVTSLELG